MRLDDYLSLMKMRMPVVCWACDSNAPEVTIELQSFLNEGNIAQAFQHKAANLCPCCLNVLWEAGTFVTHRASQRKRIREALVACSTSEEYSERRDALRNKLTALQPTKRK